MQENNCFLDQIKEMSEWDQFIEDEMQAQCCMDYLLRADLKYEALRRAMDRSEQWYTQEAEDMAERDFSAAMSALGSHCSRCLDKRRLPNDGIRKKIKRFCDLLKENLFLLPIKKLFGPHIYFRVKFHHLFKKYNKKETQ